MRESEKRKAAERSGDQARDGVESFERALRQAYAKRWGQSFEVGNPFRWFEIVAAAPDRTERVPACDRS